jgi:hypothetical protein
VTRIAGLLGSAGDRSRQLGFNIKALRAGRGLSQEASTARSESGAPVQTWTSRRSFAASVPTGEWQMKNMRSSGLAAKRAM